ASAPLYVLCLSRLLRLYAFPPAAPVDLPPARARPAPRRLPGARARRRHAAPPAAVSVARGCRPAAGGRRGVRVSRPAACMTNVRAPRALDLYLLAAFLAALLVAQQTLNNGITSDGALYFSHLRSVVFDRDLDIAAELEVLRQPPRPHHVVPIGPAI